MKTLTEKNGIFIDSFGRDGGDQFSAEYIKSIALRTGSEVDAIIINGNQHGANGGDKSATLVFDPDEFISTIQIRSDSRIDYLKFITNTGREIGGGGNGGDYHELNNVRVIAIGGRSGSSLDQIQITYVENYVGSVLVKSKAQFVIGFTPQNTTLKEYEDKTYRTTDSYQNITETMLSQQYNASVEAEYYAKVAASTEIKYVNTSTTTISHELVQELKSGTSKETTIGAGQVGVLLLGGSIMKSSDGKHWMFPTTGLSYAVISIDDYKNVLNHYDLTGELATQMPELIKFRVESDGYVFYQG